MNSETSNEQCGPMERLGGVVLVNLATLTWSTNVVLGRWLRDEIGPLTLAAARFTVAALLLAVLLRRQPPEERSIGRDRWLLLGMAVSGVVLFAPILYLGLRFTTAINATLISGFGPLITGVLAALLIREPMSGRQVGGAVVGLIGIVILISGGSLALWRTLHNNAGDLIIQGATTLWGMYSVIGRRVMHHRSTISATAFSAFLGLPFLLIAAFLEARTFPVIVSPKLLLAALYIGIGPTVVGFLSWNTGVCRLGPSGAMVFYNTLPLYGALLGFLFLGESIGLSHVIGGALIIGGGVWAARATGP